MKQLVEDVIVEMILDDVLHGGHLFEANPNHDSKGRFTSKGATELYQAGALAFGRAKGMKAKVQGLGKAQIRAAIKGGIEQHLSKQGDREAGQAPGSFSTAIRNIAGPIWIRRPQDNSAVTPALHRL